MFLTCGCSSGSADAEKGIAAARAHDWDLALSCFNAALKSDPKNAEWLARRGGVYFCLDNNDQAIADCSESIRTNEQCVRAYCNRAFAYQAKGDINSALKDCKKAVEIAEATQVDLGFAHNASGIVNLSIDEIGVAFSDAQAALKTDPSNKNYQKLLSDVQDRKGELVKKLSALKTKLQVASNELGRLRGTRTGHQSDEEFDAAEAKVRAEEKAELESAQNDYLKVFNSYQKLETETAVSAGGAQSQMKLIDEKGKLDQAEIHLHDLQQGLGRQKRSLARKMELAQEKMVDALTRQINDISQELQTQ